MNIFKFGYGRKRYIKQFFKNIKYAYQRCVRGYADCDCWNIDMYIGGLLASMLRDLADNGTGWPGEDNGVKGPEEWEKMLKVCADKLEFCVTDPLDDEKVKEYYKLMESYLYSQNAQKRGDLINHPVYKDMNKYTESKEKWSQAIEDGYEAREKAKNEAFDFLKEYWFSLWD